MKTVLPLGAAGDLATAGGGALRWPGWSVRGCRSPPDSSSRPGPTARSPPFRDAIEAAAAGDPERTRCSPATTFPRRSPRRSAAPTGRSATTCRWPCARRPPPRTCRTCRSRASRTPTSTSAATTRAGRGQALLGVAVEPARGRLPRRARRLPRRRRAGRRGPGTGAGGRVRGPVHGRPGHRQPARETVINASWGLGEAVVGGQVTPDTVTVTRGVVTRATHGDKAVMTVRTAAGTEDRAVPDELRDRPVLDEAQAVELAALGGADPGAVRRAGGRGVGQARRRVRDRAGPPDHRPPPRRSRSGTTASRASTCGPRATSVRPSPTS